MKRGLSGAVGGKNKEESTSVNFNVIIRRIEGIIEGWKCCYCFGGNR